MAVWGKGDPRWLVEERPDAKNVNNWHWTEKNASHWSKEKFKDILVGTKISTDFAQCEINEVIKCEGDAVVNNRKAKLIFFYEWSIVLKWSGALVNGDTPIVTGTVEIPNLSEEHDMKDVDMMVKLETSGPEAEIVKDMMAQTGGEVIRRQLSVYVTDLREEFSQGLILPTKDSPSSEETKCEVPKGVEKVDKETSDSALKKSFETSDIRTTETFKCTAEEFFQTLTVKELVQAFTQGNCVLEPVEGGKFELFDNNVQGIFTKLESPKLVEQTWRLKSWPKGHYSKVRMEIHQKSDCTEVSVLQTGVPATEVENTRQGWKRFYWESINRRMGYGVVLF